jgi:hypothetical protein
MSDEKLPQEENEKEISTNETAEQTNAEAETVDTSNEGTVEETVNEAAAEETKETENPSEESSENSLEIEDSATTKTTQDEKNPEKGSVVEAAMVEEKKAVEEQATLEPTAVEKIESSETEPAKTTVSDDDAAEVEDEEEVASSEDEEEDEDTEDKAQKDYSTLSEKELVAELENLLKSKKIQELKHDVEEIRSEFNSKFNEELERKKEEFLAEGGNIIDFHYTTPLKKEFNSLYFDYKERRNNHYKNLKKDLQSNLEKRWELIEELKGLLGAEENINTTYKHFKEIQEKWHVAGAIPRDKYNTVWNTYHHHVENFYDFLHLNREFRDLDFKHNLDAKLKLITRAEELTQEADINKAFRELQMLHKMWKEDIGPVAKEYRDEVWDKFSEATKIIHDKRQGQLAEMEKDFEDNLKKKSQIIEDIKKAAEEAKPSHQGWQNAIKIVQELRDAFFQYGKGSTSK